MKNILNQKLSFSELFTGNKSYAKGGGIVVKPSKLYFLDDIDLGPSISSLDGLREMSKIYIKDNDIKKDNPQLVNKIEADIIRAGKAKIGERIVFDWEAGENLEYVVIEFNPYISYDDGGSGDVDFYVNRVEKKKWWS